ncbi:hypothetical protein CI610_01750 [invertebrate metagenome]|uniref:Uncharacterized protein n=1 Tax=invertebrate metagenome TaxID=1711999 RepID=A0A2H9T7R8_9ZZZZ
MSGSIAGGSSKSSTKSSSRVSTSEELEAYFSKINQLSGGRLQQMATQGTPTTQYNQLTPEELKRIGGAGETRRNVIYSNLSNTMDRVSKDPSMTYAQKQRSNQLANEAATNQLDAINKETEAALTGLSSQERMRDYQARLANAGLTRQDLALLSQIYFGGKGQYSQSKSKSSAWNAQFSGGVK